MASSAPLPKFTWPLHATPRVHLAGRFPLDDENFESRYQSRTHALHLYEYSGTIAFNGRCHDLQPGDVTLSPAGGVTTYALPEPGHHYCIHFHPTAEAGRKFTLPCHLRLGSHYEDAVLKIMGVAQLLAEQPRSTSLAAAAAGAALQQLLLWLGLQQRRSVEPRQPMRSRVDQAVEQAAEWLAAHLDQPFEMDALLRNVGFSHNYLARIFRERYGVTIPHFLLLRRIQFARYLLEATNLPIKAVGARVGMPDAQYFNKQFRRWAGCSPSAARRRDGNPEVEREEN